MGDGLFEPEFTDPRAADRERRIRLVVEELRKHPTWPADDRSDRQFALDLIVKYPTTDLPSEIASWRAWMMEFEPKPGKGVKLRARVLRWFRNERDWKAGSSRRPVGDGVRRTRSTAPRTAADFADHDGHARPW